MKTIYARKEENFEDLLQRFKKSVSQSGVIQECKKREFFMNKAEKRRYKQSNRKGKKR